MHIPREHRAGAFTLVEMLVVVSTVALLVLLLFVALKSATEGARLAGCSLSMRQLGLEVQACAADNNAALPWVDQSLGSLSGYWYMRLMASASQATLRATCPSDPTAGCSATIWPGYPSFTCSYGYNKYFGIYTTDKGWLLPSQPFRQPNAARIPMLADAVSSASDPDRPAWWDGTWGIDGVYAIKFRHNGGNAAGNEANMMFLDGHMEAIKVSSHNPSAAEIDKLENTYDFSGYFLQR